MGLQTFESDLISIFLSDKKRYVKFSDRIKPDHFQNDILRWSYKVLDEYFRKYKELPTKKVFKNELLRSSFSSEERKIYFDAVKKLFLRKPKTSTEYIEKNIHEHLEKEEFLKAVTESIDSLEKEGISGAKSKLLKNILIGNLEDQVSIEFVLRDWKLRQAIRKELKKISPAKRFVPTPYVKINSATRGIQVSEAATVAGLTNIGKSIVAVEFGVVSMLEGLNVLHFVFENTVEQTAGRYDSRISEIEYNTIKFYEFKEKEIKKFKEIFNILSSKLKNEVMIVEALRKDSDIVFIDKVFENSILEGRNIDFVIIDSCDIMKAIGKHEARWQEKASIYWDFKDFVRIRKVPGLTTTQLVKGARTKDDPGSEDLADAYDKARILDIVYVMSQTQENIKDNIVKFKITKNRDGKSSVHTDLFKDSEKMRFVEVTD